MSPQKTLKKYVTGSEKTKVPEDEIARVKLEHQKSELQELKEGHKAMSSELQNVYRCLNKHISKTDKKFLIVIGLLVLIVLGVDLSSIIGKVFPFFL